jgi:large subunit ribosomal protein L13
MSDTQTATKKVVRSVKPQTTFRPKNVNFQREWYLLDASKKSLGRIATEAARILMGKNRSDFSQDVDRGGVVVITNVEKVQLTGKKPIFKTYFRHTGRPGSQKVRNFAEQLAADPTKPIYIAIKGMLPKNRLQAKRMNDQLKLVVGEEVNFTQKLTKVI